MSHIKKQLHQVRGNINLGAKCQSRPIRIRRAAQSNRTDEYSHRRGRLFISVGLELFISVIDILKCLLVFETLSTSVGEDGVASEVAEFRATRAQDPH